MIEQQGQVVRIQKNNAFVRVGATAGCPACEAGKGCGGGIFARLVPKKSVTLEVKIYIDSPKISVGQQVILGLPEIYFLRWTGLMFGLPLVVGLVAASLAQWLRNSRFPEMTSTSTDILVLLVALIAAGCSLLFIRKQSLQNLNATKQLSLLSVMPVSSCVSKKS